VDWKARQDIYHRCFITNDLISNMEVSFDTNPHNIIERVCSWFYTVEPTTVYPYKSYFVAVVYAICLTEWFGENVIYYLSQPDLLYNNDPCFITYENSKNIYDGILEHLRLTNYNIVTEQRGLTKIVRNFCKLEFLIEETHD
jgi:hypothetical protein